MGKCSIQLAVRLGLALLVGWLAFAKPADAADPPIALSAQLTGDDTRTRFTAELSYPVSYSVYVLSNPYRVLIDLPEVNFQFPDGLGTDSLGLIAAYRYGAIEAGRSRIVIETEGPALIERSFIVKAKRGKSARIVVDLVKTDEVGFRKARAEEEAADGLQPVSLPSPAKAIAASKPSVKTGHRQISATERSAPKPAKRADGRRVIVIDPGHGGIDPGAVGLGAVREKDVVLAFGLALRDRLARSGKYEVVMTRDSDRFVSLRDRVRVARNRQADLMVAIHADTLRGRAARGATIYTLSDKASDAEAEALAQKENRADIIAGIDLAAENEEVADILIDLVQRETKYHSLTFANKAAGQLKSVTLMTGRPLRSAGFVVLKAPDVPSILLELGYLSNNQDVRLLTSAKWRNDAASALARAIDTYFSPEVAATR
jgi:N-acetylmuramoyl-L-alanine amidase